MAHQMIDAQRKEINEIAHNNSESYLAALKDSSQDSDSHHNISTASIEVEAGTNINTESGSPSE